jgi:hypothetical protein
VWCGKINVIGAIACKKNYHEKIESTIHLWLPVMHNHHVLEFTVIGQRALR